MTDLEGAVERVKGWAALPETFEYPSANDVRAILDALASITRERDAMREVGKPFFDLAKTVTTPPAGSPPWWQESQDWTVVFSFAGCSVTLGDLRRAAALVNGEGGEMGAELEEQFRPPAKFRPAIRRRSKQLAKVLMPLAHSMGYGLMVHGSLERDLDLLAVPWVEDAAPPRELVKALAKAAGGYWSAEPTKKPHGREAYTIILRRAVETPAGAFPFIDLSVMPVTRPAPTKES